MHDIYAMSGDHARRAEAWADEAGDAGRARAVADYVAGMTDRYANSEFRRLVNPDHVI
jgi:dGTPase